MTDIKNPFYEAIKNAAKHRHGGIYKWAKAAGIPEGTINSLGQRYSAPDRDTVAEWVASLVGKGGDAEKAAIIAVADEVRANSQKRAAPRLAALEREARELREELAGRDALLRGMLAELAKLDPEAAKRVRASAPGIFE